MEKIIIVELFFDFGHRARFPAKYWDYRDLVLAEKFQFSTNAIESLNRSIKQFLGLGYLDFRETILRENNIFNILKKFESLTQSEKMPPYSFICWKLVSSLKKLLVRNISIVCRHLLKLKLSKLNHRFV